MKTSFELFKNLRETLAFILLAHHSECPDPHAAENHLTRNAGLNKVGVCVGGKGGGNSDANLAPELTAAPLLMFATSGPRKLHHWFNLPG